jgi:hypothetical protein
MTLQEKVLYHQIHPLKLGTDITSAIVSTYFLWVHNLPIGLLVMFIPAFVASGVLLATADLAWLRDSAVGRYLSWSMTHAMEALRFAGIVPMSFGAWFHQPLLIALGLAMVLFGWLRGVIFPRRPPKGAQDV